VATLVSLYPLLLAGFARDGAPVFLSRPAGLPSVLRSGVTPQQLLWAHVQQARPRCARGVPAGLRCALLARAAPHTRRAHAPEPSFPPPPRPSAPE
jgi:hypothetical protein